MLNIYKLKIEEIKKAWKENRPLLYINEGYDRVCAKITNIIQFGTGFWYVDFVVDGKTKTIMLGPSGCEINSGNFVFWEID